MTHALKIGLIGLDTTHAVAFTKILQDPFDAFHIPGAQVVAAWPGGSADMKISASRVQGFTETLQHSYGIPILKSPQEVAEKSDLVFILSSDGRTHPNLLRDIVKLGKPIFIDKPFAISTSDAHQMFKFAETSGVKLFASSAFRYADGLVSALESIRSSGERVESCQVRCWLPIEPTQGRYFWYGIHASEMLSASMGYQFKDVSAEGTDAHDKIKVSFQDGRNAEILGSRQDQTFGLTLKTNRRTIDVDLSGSAPSLSSRILRAALDVLTSGNFPKLWKTTAHGSVSGIRAGRFLDPVKEESIQVIRLLEAAQESFASKKNVTI